MEPVPFDLINQPGTMNDPSVALSLAQLIANRDNDLYSGLGFMQASLKISNYLKDNSDEKIFADAYAKVSSLVKEQDSKYTDYVIDNIDKIDFSRVGLKIKEDLNKDLEELEALKSDYNQKIKSFENLDAYKNRSIQELLIPESETGKQFLEALDKHIDSIISSKVIEDDGEIFKNKIASFISKIERFQFLKDTEEGFGVCSLCMDKTVNVTFNPCHHCCCSGCFNLFNLSGKCPLCRQNITSHQNIYL